MDQNLVFAKTPTGDEAVRQSTRVVQRSLRMLLVQVDGRLTVADLVAKMGDQRLVEDALRELEEGGFIAPTSEALSAWQDGRQRLRQMRAAQEASGLSTADVDSVDSHHIDQDDPESLLPPPKAQAFSTYGKPVLPTAEKHATSPEPEPEAPARRGALAGKGVLVAILGGVVALVALYFLFPYGRFKPGIEAEIARIVQRPVAIGEIRPRLLPAPALVLTGVQVGRSDEAGADEIRLPALAAISGGPFEQVTVTGARVAANLLLDLPIFGGAAPNGQPSVKLQRLTVERLTVTAGALKIADLKGDVAIGSDGRISNVALQSADRSLRLGVALTPEGPQVSFEGLAWRPIDDFPMTLDSLQAKALLQPGRLLVQKFEANAMGGVVQGSWLVDWSSGLAMAGDGSYERLDARRVTSIFVSSLSLEGLLTGTLRLRAAGSDWRALWANVEGQGDVTVMRGVLNGVDLGEAARRGPGSTVRAGSTKFERTTLRLAIDPRQVSGRDVAMSAGLFNANGNFVVNRERAVEGSVVVNMHSSVSSLSVPVRVSGVLPNLQAGATR